MSLIYTKMKIKDHKEVRELIKEAWFEDENVSEHAKKAYSKGYVYMYKREARYAVVAKSENGNIEGFLLGKVGCPNVFKYLFYSIKLILLGFTMLFYKDGRRGLSVTIKTWKMNHQLKKMVSRKLNNELLLFIVKKESRSNGIGSAMREAFEQYLTDNHKENVYLYTDTYSNYAYYERKGYSRSGTVNVKFFDEEPAEYYIYVKDLKNESTN